MNRFRTDTDLKYNNNGNRNNNMIGFRTTYLRLIICTWPVIDSRGKRPNKRRHFRGSDRRGRMVKIGIGLEKIDFFFFGESRDLGFETISTFTAGNGMRTYFTIICVPTFPTFRSPGLGI